MTGQNAARAVLWDMDGTVVDTARFHVAAWREVLSGLGPTVTHERFVPTIARRNDAAIRDQGLPTPRGDAGRLDSFTWAR